MGSNRNDDQMNSEMQNVMRQRALQRQEMNAPGSQMPRERPSQPSPGRSGIVFGPGRASRLPDQGTPEYDQLLQRVRGLAQ